ncbi:FAD-dependent oxidoreductase [Brevibacterium sp. 50QC2O2]|uniref:FAD-dependent oxidoreductase n=1 Tax=Brevibacterium sp. 50QC2O2 TaxID=2968459 RepID=UPI00211CBA2C|nr:FAD-dependent oxidoreductase [Brevibacterium sp. 50QC2O2]MCQ9389777.1 FAD-dependent oxidoreductase [Brevibacterium sp. 50QC2O2]
MRIIVAGAGVVGLSIAWELLNRGHQVTVCDATPGNGASHAAAGMLAPAAEMVWGEDELAPIMARAARLYPDFEASVRLASGIDAHRKTEGTLVIGAERSDAQRIWELIEAQRAAGNPTERLTGSQARRLEPALGPRIVGGVSHPGDHQIDPRTYAVALQAALLAKGATFVRANVARVVEAPAGGSATAILDDGDAAPSGALSAGATAHPETAPSSPATGYIHPAAEHRIGAEGTRLEADEIILATAVWQVPGVEELNVRPQRGDVIRVRIPAGHPPLVSRVVRGQVAGRPIYLVPRFDNSLVIGATTREDDLEAPSTEGVWQLLDDARRIVPGIVDTTIDDVVARSRPGTHDGLPIIGRLAPGIIASTGFSRHGILLSPWGAAVTADVAEAALPDGAGTRAPLTPEELAASATSSLSTTTGAEAAAALAADPLATAPLQASSAAPQAEPLQAAPTRA